MTYSFRVEDMDILLERALEADDCGLISIAGGLPGKTAFVVTKNGVDVTAFEFEENARIVCRKLNKGELK